MLPQKLRFLRPAIAEVVNKFFDCGDLEHGFTRIRCDHCKKDHLLAFSCKGHWFCPSCHQKKVKLFGALVVESILFSVPHRHYTLGIPKMLRPYFRYNRDLLKDLCRIARDCLIDYQREILQLPDGIPGAVMAIHTFGEYLDFHPHLHALVADVLFWRGCIKSFQVVPFPWIRDRSWLRRSVKLPEAENTTGPLERLSPYLVQRVIYNCRVKRYIEGIYLQV